MAKTLPASSLQGKRMAIGHLYIDKRNCKLLAYADTVRLCLARNRYKAGTSTMGNLLEAQLLSQQSKDKLTDAYADLKMRQLDYRQATGPSRTF